MHWPCTLCLTREGLQPISTLITAQRASAWASEENKQRRQSHGKHLMEVARGAETCWWVIAMVGNTARGGYQSRGSFGENKAMCKKWRRYLTQVKACWASPFSCMSHLKHCRCCLYKLARTKWQDESMNTAVMKHYSAARQHYLYLSDPTLGFCQWTLSKGLPKAIFCGQLKHGWDQQDSTGPQLK